MAKRNREKLMKKSLYDMIFDMNVQLRDVNHAEVTYFQKIGKEEVVVTEYACIMDCFEKSEKVSEKCCKDCAACIQEWLNAYPF